MQFVVRLFTSFQLLLTLPAPKQQPSTPLHHLPLRDIIPFPSFCFTLSAHVQKQTATSSLVIQATSQTVSMQISQATAKRTDLFAQHHSGTGITTLPFSHSFEHFFTLPYLRLCQAQSKAATCWLSLYTDEGLASLTYFHANFAGETSHSHTVPYNTFNDSPLSTCKVSERRSSGQYHLQLGQDQ